jgi:hypothetical protein
MRISAVLLIAGLLIVAPLYAQEKELTTEERLKLLEKKVEELESSRVGDMPVLKKLRMRFELELEWMFAQRDMADSTQRGQLDKFTMELDAEFDKHISLVAQGRFEAEEAWVKTAYCQAARLPLGQRFRFGLDERIFKPSRRTESYPLIGSAFWRTHDFGVFYRMKIPHSKDRGGYSYLKLAATNGLTLDRREPGEQEQYYLICDRKPPSGAGLGENEEYSAVIGSRLDLGKRKWLDVSLFGLLTRLDDDDAAFLNLHIKSVDTTLGTARRGGSKWRRGAAASARFGDLRFQGMYIKARDSGLFREGFYVQGGYTLDMEFQWLKSAELLVRTGHLLIDMEKSIAQPMSWDREEFTVAALLEIRDGVLLKLEYTVYGEDPGPGQKQVKNNEFVFQVELKF